MQNLVIRKEEEKDFIKVVEVVRMAFENAEHSDKDEHNLVQRLRMSKAFVPELSLVAEKDGKILGHILFTEITIDGNKALALAPLSVLPEYHNMGIGSKLIEKGHEVAKKLGYCAVVILGHEDYYPRFGYTKAIEQGIKAPFDVPEECFMVYELRENGLKNMKGVVEYAPEFF